MPATKKQHKGGFKYTFSTNENKLHHAFKDAGLQFGGTTKGSGEIDPTNAVDYFRVVLFLVYGVPLDKPLDKETKQKLQKAVKAIEKEREEA